MKWGTNLISSDGPQIVALKHQIALSVTLCWTLWRLYIRQEDRVSNSLVCVRPLSRGPAGRPQRLGSSTAIKEEKVCSH